MSPRQIVNANKKRDGESPQGYANRLLEFASMHYTTGALDLAISLLEREQGGRTGEAEDALSNGIIAISEHKAMVTELYEIQCKEGSAGR